jgi:hypothetical protein
VGERREIMFKELIATLEAEKEKADRNYCSASSPEEAYWQSGIAAGLVFALDRLKDYQSTLEIQKIVGGGIMPPSYWLYSGDKLIATNLKDILD